jgi:hypothetical protein
MNSYIHSFEERLRSLFTEKAAEFSKYAEEQPATAMVTGQLAGLYNDLVEALSH